MECKDFLANKLVQLREEHKLTQQQLADKLQITRQSLSLYEKGERTINIELLAKIADIFKTTTDYLLGLSDTASINPDIQTTHALTGLTEEAITKLIKNKPINIHTSQLIESNDFWEIVRLIMTAKADADIYTINVKNVVSSIVDEFFNRDIPKVYKKALNLVSTYGTRPIYISYITECVENFLDNQIAIITGKSIDDFLTMQTEEVIENGKHNTEKE
jgi:transcriptional regulator with XRE-family HTH domain